MATESDGVFLLRINGDQYAILGVEQLRHLLSKVHGQKYSEVVLWLGALPEHCLSALVNGKHAWLMYTRNIDEVCFTSRNPSYSGAQDAHTDFLLSNGQMDQYPASWTLPTDQVLTAIEYFFIHKNLPPWVTWHDDFGAK